jgi:hypothetical protein
MPGIPVGPGTVFYLLAALAMPVVGVGRWIVGRGDASALRPTARQAAVALGMVCTGALSFWLFDRVGSALDAHRATSAVLLTSPLLIAVVVLAVMTAISRVMRRVSR